MFLPIALFAAAGALAVGGTAGASLLYQRGRQLAASRSRAQDIIELQRLLRAEIDLAKLRAEAMEQGVDPKLVEQGYMSLRDGSVTMDQVIRLIEPESGQ